MAKLLHGKKCCRLRPQLPRPCTNSAQISKKTNAVSSRSIGYKLTTDLTQVAVCIEKRLIKGFRTQKTYHLHSDSFHISNVWFSLRSEWLYLKLTHNIWIHVNKNNIEMTIYKYWQTWAVIRISIKYKMDYNRLSDPTDFNRNTYLNKGTQFITHFCNLITDRIRNYMVFVTGNDKCIQRHHCTYLENFFKYSSF